MKIAVCVKQVPDATSHKRLDPGTHRLDRSGEGALNATDVNAVEEALRLRDAHGGEVVVVSLGPEKAMESLRKALAMGADAVMLGVALARATDAPGKGFHWGPEAHHPKLPRGRRVKVDQVASLEEILYGPAPVADGTANLIGALRKSMATTGYSDLKEFQRVEVVVAPYSTR